MKKTQLSWLCAAALGLMVLPLELSQAAPQTSAATSSDSQTAVTRAVSQAAPVKAASSATSQAAPVTGVSPVISQAAPVMATSPATSQNMPASATHNGLIAPLVDSTPASATPSDALPTTLASQPGNPSREVNLKFTQIAPPPGSMVLTGSNPEATVEFGMRRDEVASSAVLNLEYTPSPSLIPLISQFKVYLNDELMGAVPFTKEELGKKNTAQIPIDPLYITDFNQVRLEFIGQYGTVCTNLGNPTLWLDMGRNSNLDVAFESLPLQNDLAYFPIPFYDQRDMRGLNLPFVFPDAPGLGKQQAAGVLASWFGAQAGWRGQTFPALYNQLPQTNAIVFATNDQRPDFLRDHPPVTAPTIEMVNHPDSPYQKLLVIFGRDDKDLTLAVQGIVSGNLLFRGNQVTVNSVKSLADRKPYDAPNWTHTDRPITFGELRTYPEQLQSTGMTPAPIAVTINLPPDLYLLRTNSIDMKLNYRYTSPPAKDSSRMDVSLNNQFLQSFPLLPKEGADQLLLHLPVLQGLLDAKKDVAIPALRLGAANQLRFDFQFMNPMPGGSLENCVTYQPIKNRVVIDDDSTLDFSQYYHFMAMPDLHSYANSGFPFSRMADLSDTLVVMPEQPTQEQVTTLLNALGTLGTQTGLAGSRVTITNDAQEIKNHDADLLVIGAIPPSLKDDSKINLLVDATRSWVKVPVRVESNIMPGPEARAAETLTNVSADGPMGAIISFQSPFYDQRSVVALLADGPAGYTLLNEALNDSGKRQVMDGSAIIVRDSGVNGVRVGDIYYVGHLPWFERLWYALSNHPILLASFAAISVVLLAWVLWRLLRAISRRRLRADD